MPDRSDGAPRHVVITGASSGIGAALARAYAAPEVRLSLLGRDARRLNATAEACRSAGAAVGIGVIDVTHRRALAAWLTAVDDERAVDLVVANAGRTCGIGADGEPEPEAAVRDLFEVNYFGQVATVETLLPRLRARGRGQLALMSSLAAFRAAPMAPTYAATKAAVKLYGEALRARLSPVGIRVSVICPGFVDTPMTAHLSGRRVGMVTAADAAARIRRGLARNEAIIAFPWSFYLGVRLLPLLPGALVGPIVRRFDYRVEPPRR